MTLVTTKKSFKAPKHAHAHMDEIDEQIVEHMRKLGNLFHTKAAQAVTDAASPDEIHSFVSQARAQWSKAATYERKKRVQYEAKMEHNRY